MRGNAALPGPIIMPRPLHGLATSVVVLALATGCTLPGPLSDTRPAERATPYVVPRSEVRSMRSATGVEYRILVARPAAPAPASGYPVLYLLDGDDSFAIAAATAERLARHGSRSGVGPGLVVGIGYPGESRRRIDYTPATDKPVQGPDGRMAPSGGAQEFRNFIASELQPAIASAYPIDPDRQALMGHSYGGLFVLDTLFRQPELFRTYVASSPSIWFGGGEVLRHEAAFVEAQRRARRRIDLVLSVGELEEPPARPASAPIGGDAGDDRLSTRRMVGNSRALAQRLEALADTGLSVRIRILGGEDHGSAPLPAIGTAVRHAFGD